MTRVCIVICTFNRPAQLQRAVASVRAQEFLGGVAASVLVVDNSADANAAPLLDLLRQGPGLAVDYLSLPVPNISLARNAGIAGCGSDWVIFLDDDQWVEPGWLAAYLATASSSGADMLFGPVLADFAGGPPAWDPDARRFERRFPVPSGTNMTARRDPRAPGRWLSTGNSMLRRATCLAEPAPFDPRLGRSGGEDTDLFLRLAASGRRMAWCAEAVAHDLVPPERTSFDYIVYRTGRAARQWAWITIHRARRPLPTALRVAIRAIGQLLLVQFSADARQRRLGTAQALGKLFWWRLPPSYS